MKVLPRKPQGSLKPNEIPEGPWQTITRNLITNLSMSEEMDSIFVIVDTKQAHFIPTTKDITAKGIAELFL